MEEMFLETELQILAPLGNKEAVLPKTPRIKRKISKRESSIFKVTQSIPLQNDVRAMECDKENEEEQNVALDARPSRAASKVSLSRPFFPLNS